MELREAKDLIRNDFLFQQKSPAVWADLGCGSGLFTKALASFLFSGSTVYAVDKHPAIQEQTLNKVRIIPVQADFVGDEFQIGKPDGVLMANSLHYVKDKLLFLDKLKKNIKENAPFLIVEYDTERPVPVWVPYPVSFNLLMILFKGAGYPSVQKLGVKASRFRQDNLYGALAKK